MVFASRSFDGLCYRFLSPTVMVVQGAVSELHRKTGTRIPETVCVILFSNYMPH
jgi:hypothetical protein